MDQGELFFIPGNDSEAVPASGRAAAKTGKCRCGCTDRIGRAAKAEEGEATETEEGEAAETKVEEDAKTEAAENCCPQAKGMKQIVRIHSRVTLFFISSPLIKSFVRLSGYSAEILLQSQNVLPGMKST